jgi:hypothetical protein
MLEYRRWPRDWGPRPAQRGRCPLRSARKCRTAASIATSSVDPNSGERCFGRPRGRKHVLPLEGFVCRQKL